MESAQRLDICRNCPAYGEDYAAWIQHQLTLLRDRRLDEIDYDNLIDEFGDLAKLNANALASGLEAILTSMLKWDTDEAQRTRNTAIDVSLGRMRVEDVIGDSPSMEESIDNAIDRAYRFARFNVSGELDLPLTRLAEANPYRWSDVMRRDFRVDEDDE